MYAAPPTKPICKTVYKLTDQNMQTHDGFRWELGTEVRTSGEGDLCGPGWLHCYSDPLLAILLNPIHADIENPRLFRAEVSGNEKHDHGLKSGYTVMRLVEELPVPVITTEQLVRFAILCSLTVFHDPGYVAWAENWLTGKDRSAQAAETVETAVRAAAQAAWSAQAAAARAAAQAAWAAAQAARSAQAARTAAQAAAQAAAWAAARAARSARAAARAAAQAAAWAVGWAARAAQAAQADDIDLIAIVHEAIEAGQ